MTFWEAIYSRHSNRYGMAVIFISMLGLTACESTKRSPYLGGRVDPMGAFASGVREVNDDVSYWDGMSAGGGSPSIVVNLTEQRAYFYQGNKLIGLALVATGREGFGTPEGIYKIIEKVPDKRSNLYGTIYDAAETVVNPAADIRKDPIPPGGSFEGAHMPSWMRLTTGGIGLHMGPIPVPGSPASHGCIRVSKLVIQDFYDAAPLGTPVRIVY